MSYYYYYYYKTIQHSNYNYFLIPRELTLS